MYVLLSDLHFHKFSSFSHITPEGLNSRLKTTLDEVRRANDVLRKKGGKLMVLAGDIFHVRGKISPEVLNPVLELFNEIKATGTRIVGISGNHDLESNSSNDLSSAATALSSVGVEIFNTPTEISHGEHKILLVPYIDSLTELKDILETHADGKLDLIIHAPVDGVIAGLPSHGLDPEYLGVLGYKRVFAGHYHNHKDFENNVYSIGATSHQTWGDVGSRSGFLIVDYAEILYQASRAPSFIDLDPETDKDDVHLIVDGNFVRVTLEIEKESQVAEMRDFLMKECGAKGVLINRIKKAATVSRTGATASSGKSISVSVGEFIKGKKYGHQSELVGLCEQILSETEVAE